MANERTVDGWTTGTPAPWEQELRRGLDALSDTRDEAAPPLPELERVVRQVQADVRRSTRRDVGVFLVAAAGVLGAVLYAGVAWPAAFWTLQVAVTAALVLAAAFHRNGGKEAAE